MERAIGEVFEYEGKKLKVVSNVRGCCFNCYFYYPNKIDCTSVENQNIIGSCCYRTFQEVQE